MHIYIPIHIQISVFTLCLSICHNSEIEIDGCDREIAREILRHRNIEIYVHREQKHVDIVFYGYTDIETEQCK